MHPDYSSLTRVMSWGFLLIFVFHPDNHDRRVDIGVVDAP